MITDNTCFCDRCGLKVGEREKDDKREKDLCYNCYLDQKGHRVLDETDVRLWNKKKTKLRWWQK